MKLELRSGVTSLWKGAGSEGIVGFVWPMTCGLEEVGEGKWIISQPEIDSGGRVGRHAVVCREGGLEGGELLWFIREYGEADDGRGIR